MQNDTAGGVFLLTIGGFVFRLPAVMVVSFENDTCSYFYMLAGFVIIGSAIVGIFVLRNFDKR